MNRPVQIGLVLLAIAVVLGIIGAVLAAVRWLLYVAVVVLLAAGAVRFLTGSDRR